MAQHVRVLAAKPEYHSLIPGPHAVEGGNYMRSSLHHFALYLFVSPVTMKSL